MTHARCAACQVRTWRVDADEVCPSCGGPLETVRRAEELIGLRAVGRVRRDDWSLADHVRATIERNDAARARRLHQRPDDRPS
jgi:uncharacterized Zn finger protein (UPF0148 family)